MSDHRNEHAAPGGLRLARTNYTVRTVSFAYCFLVIGLVLLERKMGMLAWGLLALQFLIYPQLAFLHAMAAKDARRAELRNLYASPSYGRLLSAEDLARGADAFRRVHEEDQLREDQLRVRGAVSRVTHYVVLFGEMNGQGGLGEEWPAKSA